MRTTFSLRYVIAVATVFAASVQAQDWASQKLEKSPRHREWVKVTHDGRTVDAFMAYPEVKDKAPVILVIHEIFGMTDWVQEVADEFAAAGYIAIAPDLLSGMGPGGKGTSSLSQSEVTKAVSGLNPDQVTADLQATADFALKFPAAAQKLYVVGFCWGGGQSSDLQLTVPGSPPRSYSMDRHRTSKPSNELQLRSMASTLATTPALEQLYPPRSRLCRRWGKSTNRSTMKAPATDSCAPGKPPTHQRPTRKLATNRGLVCGSSCSRFRGQFKRPGLIHGSVSERRRLGSQWAALQLGWLGQTAAKRHR